MDFGCQVANFLLLWKLVKPKSFKKDSKYVLIFPMLLSYYQFCDFHEIKVVKHIWGSINCGLIYPNLARN